MRKLNDKFWKDLKEGGRLVRLTDAVKSDSSLCLELRGDYVKVYYRGGKLIEVTQTADGHRFSFDTNYFKVGGRTTLPDRREGVDAWLDVFPKLKHAIDRWLGKYKRDEREFQQILVRDNNFGTVAKSTDYYICDIEYQIARRRGRFDLIAVHWPSRSATRKQPKCQRLVFVEMKYGDDALKGSAGLCKHIRDVNSYLCNPTRVDNLKKDMVEVFNQKRDLGLIKCEKDLSTFSNKKPRMLLVFANHDPESRRLHHVLGCLPESPHAELCVATASFMGYGLYDQGVHKIDEARDRFPEYITHRDRFGKIGSAKPVSRRHTELRSSTTVTGFSW